MAPLLGLRLIEQWDVVIFADAGQYVARSGSTQHLNASIRRVGGRLQGSLVGFAPGVLCWTEQYGVCKKAGLLFPERVLFIITLRTSLRYKSLFSGMLQGKCGNVVVSPFISLAMEALDKRHNDGLLLLSG